MGMVFFADVLVGGQNTPVLVTHIRSQHCHRSCAILLNEGSGIALPAGPNRCAYH